MTVCSRLILSAAFAAVSIDPALAYTVYVSNERDNTVSVTCPGSA